MQNTWKIWKSVAFLYTNNEISEREIKESITFTTVSKRGKYLGITLPKEAKDLYSKTIRCWWKKLKITDGMIGSEESILLKWLYY